MIHGLKVTVRGDELRLLCIDQANHHIDRAVVYANQIKSMKENQIEGMAYTNGDPARALTDKKIQHEGEASELQFIADHLELMEIYQLDTEALRKLGICKRQY